MADPRDHRPWQDGLDQVLLARLERARRMSAAQACAWAEQALARARMFKLPLLAGCLHRWGLVPADLAGPALAHARELPAHAPATMVGSPESSLIRDPTPASPRPILAATTSLAVDGDAPKPRPDVPGTGSVLLRPLPRPTLAAPHLPASAASVATRPPDLPASRPDLPFIHEVPTAAPTEKLPRPDPIAVATPRSTSRPVPEDTRSVPAHPDMPARRRVPIRTGERPARPLRFDNPVRHDTDKLPLPTAVSLTSVPRDSASFPVEPPIPAETLPLARNASVRSATLPVPKDTQPARPDMPLRPRIMVRPVEFTTESSANAPSGRASTVDAGPVTQRLTAEYPSRGPGPGPVDLRLPHPSPTHSGPLVAGLPDTPGIDRTLRLPESGPPPTLTPFAPVQPPHKPLDLDALAEAVQRRLSRRQAWEHERRGGGQ